MKRFLIIAVALVAFYSSLFMIAEHQGWTEPQFMEARFQDIQAAPHGRGLAAAAVVGLLWIDLLLPVPSSLVMILSGKILGVAAGTAAAGLGAMLTAVTGFLVCRWGRAHWFRRLVKPADQQAMGAWLEKYGIFAIIISRPVPMMTEVISCLAGLSQMRFAPFVGASALGTLPVCLVYAYCGAHSSLSNPWPAVVVALLLPAAGWLVARRIRRSVHARPSAGATSKESSHDVT